MIAHKVLLLLTNIEDFFGDVRCITSKKWIDFSDDPGHASFGLGLRLLPWRRFALYVICFCFGNWDANARCDISEVMCCLLKETEIWKKPYKPDSATTNVITPAVAAAAATTTPWIHHRYCLHFCAKGLFTEDRVSRYRCEMPFLSPNQQCKSTERILAVAENFQTGFVHCIL